MAHTTASMLKALNEGLNPALERQIVDVLRQRYPGIELSKSILLSEPQRRNVIARVFLNKGGKHAPKTLIFKQVLPQKTLSDSRKKADERFFRDWVGIQFLSQLQQQKDEHNTPQFYGFDKISRFILIEDLGQKHMSLVDTLTQTKKSLAVDSLKRYMQNLGRFNALTAGKTDEYTRLLKAISSQPPSLKSDKLEVAQLFMQTLDASVLKVINKQALQRDIAAVIKANFDPGPFTALIHGDAAPDNVFIQNSHSMRLIDFEWTYPRNALLDGVYLRMSMPTAWCAKTLPEEVLEPLEKEYREILSTTIKEANNDVSYSEAYTYACAFYALHMMREFNRLNEITTPNEDTWPTGPMPESAIWDPKTNTFRSRFLTRLQTFLDIAERHDSLVTKVQGATVPILPALRVSAKTMLDHALKHWKGIKPLGTYAAFSESPQLSLAQQASLEEKDDTQKSYISCCII